MFSILAAPVVASKTGDEGLHADEPSPVQIWFDEWRSDLPPGVSLVVVGGGLINNGFPALSADGSQIAILYLTGHPLIQHYPTLDLYTTSTLALTERVELVPGYRQLMEAGREPNPLEPELIEGVKDHVDESNLRLSSGGFLNRPGFLGGCLV